MEAIDDGALTLRDRRPAARSCSTATATRRRSRAPRRPSRCCERIPGAEVVELDAGCCGMAGSFGFEAEHYELSMRIGGMRLFPAVRQEPADDVDRRHRRLLPPADRARHRAPRAPPGAARQRRTHRVRERVGMSQEVTSILVLVAIFAIGTLRPDQHGPARHRRRVHRRQRRRRLRGRRSSPASRATCSSSSSASPTCSRSPTTTAPWTGSCTPRCAPSAAAWR